MPNIDTSKLHASIQIRIVKNYVECREDNSFIFNRDDNWVQLRAMDLIQLGAEFLWLEYVTQPMSLEEAENKISDFESYVDAQRDQSMYDSLFLVVAVSPKLKEIKL